MDDGFPGRAGTAPSQPDLALALPHMTLHRDSATERPVCCTLSEWPSGREGLTPLPDKGGVRDPEFDITQAG